MERLNRLKEFSLKNAVKLGSLCAIASIPVTEFTIFSTNLLTQGALNPSLAAEIRQNVYPWLIGVGGIWGCLSGGYSERKINEQINVSSDVPQERGSKRFSLEGLERVTDGAFRGFVAGLGLVGLSLSVVSALDHTSVDKLLIADKMPGVVASGIFFTTIVETTLANSGKSFFSFRR